MNRFTLSVNLDAPDLKPDTVVEVTSTGDLETVDAAQPIKTERLDNVVAEATTGFRGSYADGARVGDLIKHHDTMTEVVDARLGATDSLVAISQPPGSENVEDAADAALQHKATLVAAVPALGSQVQWQQTRDDLARLRTVTKVKEKAQLRAKNLSILEAHLRQRIYGNLSVLRTQVAPVIHGNRSLELKMAPFSDLFDAAAEKAADTKRTKAKALDEQQKKADAKDGKDAKAEAPARDAVPADKKDAR